MPMEGSLGEVPEIVEQFFRMPLVPWSESDGGFFAPQFGYDGYGCLNESVAIPEPAISSSSAFGDLAHFINDDASSNEIEEVFVPVPVCDQMPNVSTKMKRGQKRTMNSVQEDSNNADNSINSGSCMSEDQEEPSSNPQSIYARKRRERINERLRILQNLVPNGTKVDISTMLEEAVHYVKFLQLQIKLLSSDELWMYAPIAYNGLDLKIYPLQEK